MKDNIVMMKKAVMIRLDQLNPRYVRKVLLYAHSLKKIQDAGKNIK